MNCEPSRQGAGRRVTSPPLAKHFPEVFAPCEPAFEPALLLGVSGVNLGGLREVEPPLLALVGLHAGGGEGGVSAFSFAAAASSAM